MSEAAGLLQGVSSDGVGVKSAVLLILGMHRSGTTLTASWLQKCGLHIGERLSYSWSSSPSGLYEDKDFVELHKEMLWLHGQSHLLKAPLNRDGYPQFRARAAGLLEARRSLPNWGWKDPRTALFLPFWEELLPEATCLIVYRHYTEVVDSLHRRNRQIAPIRPAYYVRGEYFEERGRSPGGMLLALERRVAARFPAARALIERAIDRPLRSFLGSYLNLPLTRLYARNWVYYNRAILDFHDRRPERCLCLSVKALLERSERLVAYLNEKRGFRLQPAPIGSVFKPERMKRQHSPWQVALCDRLEPRARGIYRRLEARQEETLKKLEEFPV